MNRELTARRRIEPRFRFARDGVHPGAEGHWILARELRRFFDQGKSPLESPDDRRYARLLKLIRSRGRILCHAWLDATGHCRPGMKKGAPLAEAKQKAERMEPRIRELSLPLIAP